MSAPSSTLLHRTRHPARLPSPTPTRLVAALGLGVIVAIQLMVVLDTTVVNVALPTIQARLGFSTAGLSWVLNAYTLAFGGLLLLGARAGDLLGRRRVLLVGIAVFTAASLAGGLAVGPELLLAARAVQGLGAAVAAPQALALLTVMFREGDERTRALGVYSAVSVGGSALGLVLGGLLTQVASWRWVFFINVPIGLALLALVPRFLPRTPARTGRFDLAGSLTGTAGMTALVYGFVEAGEQGWATPETAAALAIGALLLTAYLLIESRAAQPITPLRLFADRDRAITYGARLAVVAGMTGLFFFLTLFIQQVRGTGALVTGAEFLPLAAMMFVSSQLSARVLVPRFGAKRVLVAGLAGSTLATVWLTQITAGSGYGFLLVAFLIFGAGQGTAFVPLTSVALQGVAGEDAGAASGLVNVMQQVGASLGLSILVTVFGTATRHGTGDVPAVLVHGFAAGFVGSAVLIGGALAASLLLRPDRRRVPAPVGAAVAEGERTAV